MRVNNSLFDENLNKEAVKTDNSVLEQHVTTANALKGVFKELCS